MILPDPVPGLVVRYGFLWPHQRRQGKAEATKERPCAIVVSTRMEDGRMFRVVVAPVTHTQPAGQRTSVEIPSKIRRALGLDQERQWIRLDCLNRFAWPGFDLRPIPNQDDKIDYGMLPPSLFERVRQGVLDLNRRRSIDIIAR